MGFVFLILFIGIPLIEIAVLIQVGDLIGLWKTIGLIILTAVIGTWMLRHQGLATLVRAQKQLDRGAIPARELFDGLCLLGAGALLLTPGFVTDSMGFLLLLPPIREVLRNTLGKQITATIKARSFSAHGNPGQGHPGDPFGDPRRNPHHGPQQGPRHGPQRGWGGRRDDDTIIEGEYEDVTETDHERLN